MPIVVTCTCGRQFKAREEHLGRRASCPTCGASLLIGPPPMPVPDAIHISMEAPALTVANVADEPALSDSSYGLPSNQMSPSMKKATIIGGIVLAVMLIASVTIAIVMSSNDDGATPSIGDRTHPKEITNSIAMKLVLIPPGTFRMGSPNGETGRGANESQHRVTLSNGFYMGVTEVTQKQWKAVMGDNPSGFKGDDLPVEKVSWDDAVRFCKKLSVNEGKKYRLPTEAEWEYACRAGTMTAYHEGNTKGDLAAVGWYEGNSNGQTHAVRQKKANAWGLYDMHGNVWEWCSDWYGDYPNGAATVPTGPQNGTDRVLRGGSWLLTPVYCRVASRGRFSPDLRRVDFGFRVVLELSDVATVHPDSPRGIFDNHAADRESNGSDQVPPQSTPPTVALKPGLHNAGYSTSSCLICAQSRSARSRLEHSDRRGYGLCESCGTAYRRWCVGLVKAQKQIQLTDLERREMKAFEAIMLRHFQAGDHEGRRGIGMMFMLCKFASPEWHTLTGID